MEIITNNTEPTGAKKNPSIKHSNTRGLLRVHQNLSEGKAEAHMKHLTVDQSLESESPTHWEPCLKRDLDIACNQRL